MRNTVKNTDGSGLAETPHSHARGSKPDHTITFDPLLTVAEVAVILKTSTKTIHRRIKAKKLPAIKDGDLVRIRRGDLEAYIALHRTGGF